MKRLFEPISYTAYRQYTTNRVKKVELDLSVPTSDVFPEFHPRTTFQYDRTINWFPGHMANANVVISKWLNHVNYVIEMRDIRAPLTTSQQFLIDKYVNRKVKRLVVLNKSDLVSKRDAEKVVNMLRNQGLDVLATSVSTRRGIHAVQSRIVKEDVDFRASIGHWALVVGLPSVGKSSLINGMRHAAWAEAYHASPDGTSKLGKQRSVRVGAAAGQTKLVEPVLVSSNPKIHLIDTPGIFWPSTLEQTDVALRAAALGCANDHVVGAQWIADYVLFELNRRGMFHYVPALELDAPTNDIAQVIAHIARNEDMRDGRGSADYPAALHHFLGYFRKGHFGHFLLDELPTDEQVAERRRNLTLASEPPSPWGIRAYEQMYKGINLRPPRQP